MRIKRTILLVSFLCLPTLVFFRDSGKGSARTASPSASGIRRVLLLSIDGAHALDLANYVKSNPRSALARLSRTGITYTNANLPTPADNHEGSLSMFAGGTPISTGIWYDEVYDRTTSPPASNCSTQGSEVNFFHEADIDFTKIDGGGGFDPNKLSRDPKRGCAPIFPHNYLRVNTAFEVVKAAGMRTAWCEKHYNGDLMNGPSGHGVDDLYVREINYEPSGTHGWVNKVNERVSLTEPLDDQKVQAVINEIDGFDHSRTQRVGVPGLFGTTLQAVTVGEMQPALRGDEKTGQIEQPAGGYIDAYGTPSLALKEAWDHTDKLIGKIVDELEAQGLLSSTLVIVTGIHGQSPIDPRERVNIDKSIIPKLIGENMAKQTLDTIQIYWLKDQTQTAKVAAMLSEPATKTAGGIEDVLWGESLKLLFPDPLEDPRVPDIIVVPKLGVMYNNPKTGAIAEHGGFLHQDTNVPLLFSNPGLAPTPRVIKAVVSTTDVAPSILQTLGLDAQALEAVRIEKTRMLPGLFPEHEVQTHP
jgi:hypothetical protein